jgi:hypothetical protein
MIEVCTVVQCEAFNFELVATIAEEYTATAEEYKEKVRIEKKMRELDESTNCKYFRSQRTQISAFVLSR